MAVGDEAKIAARSYVAFGKESTYGTYASATTAVQPITASIRTDIESVKLETLNVNRGAARRVQTNKIVAGGIETYFHPTESVLLVATSMGGEITSSLLSTGVYAHSITAGNFDTTTAINSLSFNVRKGQDTTSTYRYTGGRVNALTIAGTVGEPIRITADMVFKDSTLGTDDISASLSVSAYTPWVYHQGQYIYGATTTSLTTTNAEPIQSFELVINNNLVSDGNARQLGQNVIGVLPATNRMIEFKITQRFDTTTSWQRFVQATQGSIRLQFTGASISSSNFNQCIIDMPKVYNNSNDVELPGPGEVLESEITFDVLVDNPNTTTGKDIGITFINGIASY